MKIILTLSAVFVFVLSSYVHNSFADSVLQVGSDVQLSGTLLDKPFVLHLNETKLITSDNIRIKLVNITNDSRCPSDVTCIWQGAVHVVVSVKKDGLDYGGIGLELGGDSSAEIPIFDKYFIQLLRVEPYPQSTHTIQSNEYVATFMVKKTKVESPLQQFRSGIPINQIQCKENYVVLLKPDKEFGGCFRSDSAMKLYARGWPSPNDSTGTFQNQKTAKKEEYSLAGGTPLNQDNVSGNKCDSISDQMKSIGSSINKQKAISLAESSWDVKSKVIGGGYQNPSVSFGYNWTDNCKIVLDSISVEYVSEQRGTELIVTENPQMTKVTNVEVLPITARY